MSVKILIDMNLSPAWTTLLRQHGWAAIHWSGVGDPHASDRTIMEWARTNQHVVFTHDLDFTTVLALTHAAGPSVFQVRAQNVLPDHLGGIVVAALRQHENDLLAGALVTVDESKSRIRVLPI